MKTTEDWLLSQGYERIPQLPLGAWQCLNCSGMFWFHWGDVIQTAWRHRAKCGSDEKQRDEE